MQIDSVYMGACVCVCAKRPKINWHRISMVQCVWLFIFDCMVAPQEGTLTSSVGPMLESVHCFCDCTHSVATISNLLLN